MAKESVQKATLRLARDHCGGTPYLARQVGVATIDLLAMIDGKAEIPSWVFLRAVDIVNSDDSEHRVHKPDAGLKRTSRLPPSD